VPSTTTSVRLMGYFLSWKLSRLMKRGWGNPPRLDYGAEGMQAIRDFDAASRSTRSVGREPEATVLRTSWAWAGSTIPQAPKEREFIAWGRQPQDPETRQKKPFPAPTGRHARAMAESSHRPDWGSERGSAGVAWGWDILRLRPQATNFRRCAAGKYPVICNP
jgi:hypothetical protein